ncbi:MAG TPA: hypothetical protein VGS58_00710 [Candidatus Sulfopaludibacter sp.]|nr:hypothetical protein [Candidatus Sulfopaludibacter sp.]
MRRFVFLPVLLTALWAADSQPLTVTSSASAAVGVAADSLAGIFGDSISTQTVSAGAPPWPTSLGDISAVIVTDSANRAQNAGILFISPSQMNIYIPHGVAPGPATIQFPVTGLPRGAGTAALRSVQVNIQPAAPGVFSAAGTGRGVAAATAVRVTIPTHIQSAVAVFFCTQPGMNAVGPMCSAVPIDVGLDAPVYVSLYGTGIRGASPVTVAIRGKTIQPTYAGPQGETPGLDQVNFLLPLELRGSGLVDVTVTAGGVTSNPVQLAIQ